MVTALLAVVGGYVVGLLVLALAGLRWHRQDRRAARRGDRVLADVELILEAEYGRLAALCWCPVPVPSARGRVCLRCCREPR